MDCETIVFTTRKEKSAAQQRGLDWNWRYFTAWLRIICLYPLPASASKAANGIALLVRFLLFLINVGAHVAQIFLFYKLGYETSSTTEYWNAVIDYWNWTLHNLSVHCLIFGLNLRYSKWLQLNKLLVKIDKSMQQYESKTSLRLRNRSIMGLVYIALAEGSLLISYTLVTAFEYDSKIQAAVEVTAACGKIYVTSAVIFFCLNCWVISDQFQTIGDQVTKLSKSFPVSNLADQLRILQNHHIKICRSVELLNDSFGTILLLEMFFIFTCFTNYLIKILVIFPTASTYNKISMITLLFGITGNLAMICNSAELIRSKARSIKQDLYKLSIKNPSLQPEIQSFTALIGDLDPEVSAAGYFEIGKNLIQAIAGAIVTYFIVMLQFVLDEKEPPVCDCSSATNSTV